MSRTRRKVHREYDCWDEWYRLRIERGKFLQGSTSPPKRSGGYLCDWCHSPNGKKYDKQRRVRLLRREAKDKMWREWLQWELDTQT